MLPSSSSRAGCPAACRLRAASTGSAGGPACACRLFTRAQLPQRPYFACPCSSPPRPSSFAPPASSSASLARSAVAAVAAGALPRKLLFLQLSWTGLNGKLDPQFWEASAGRHLAALELKWHAGSNLDSSKISWTRPSGVETLARARAAGGAARARAHSSPAPRARPSSPRRTLTACVQTRTHVLAAQQRNICPHTGTTSWKWTPRARAM